MISIQFELIREICNQGLDQEMPGAAYMSAAKVSAQLQAGTITQAQIDTAVLRMLVPMFAVGLFDAPPGRSEGFDSKSNCSELSRVGGNLD